MFVDNVFRLSPSQHLGKNLSFTHEGAKRSIKVKIWSFPIIIIRLIIYKLCQRDLVCIQYFKMPTKLICLVNGLLHNHTNLWMENKKPTVKRNFKTFTIS
jgi:hypothetical protein